MKQPLPKTLDASTFTCPQEVSVYLKAKRNIPKKTRAALMEMIRCAIATMKS